MSRVGIPRQAPNPMFRATATVGTNVTGVAGGGTTHAMVWGTEVYDFGGNFATNTFTAPVRGLYHFETQIEITGFDAAVVEVTVNIVADGTTYSVTQTDTGIVTDVHTITNSVDCIMDAATTAVVNVIGDQVGGADDMDVNTASTFSGFLIAAL